MINVPQAVWIDEGGHIVRPTETAGVTEGFRKMNPKTYEMPKEEMEAGAAARRRYLDAIRDWVAKGPDSKFVFDAPEARKRTPQFTPAPEPEPCKAGGAANENHGKDEREPDASEESEKRGRISAATRLVKFADEFAFWEKAKATYGAMRPTIEGGGQIMIDVEGWRRVPGDCPSS
jgi:hypothetical protein